MTSHSFGLRLAVAAAAALPLFSCVVKQEVGKDDGGGNGGGSGGDSGASPGGSGGGPSRYAALRIEPPGATVVIENGMAAQQRFTAFGKLPNGNEVRLPTAVWASTPRDRVTIASDGLATTGTVAGGDVTITAADGQLTATARLVIRVRVSNLAPVPPGAMPLPADPKGKFGGPTDPRRAPELVYPNDGVLLPPNLPRVEVHFRPRPENTLFQVSFSSAHSEVVVYTRCLKLEDGCVYEPAAAIWDTLAESNRGGDPVKLQVRSTDDAGAAVGESITHTLRWSQDAVKGALYYWTTSNGTGIMRWNFGDTTQKEAEKVVGTQHSGGICVGCHALSRDCKKMVLSAGGQHDGRLLLFDLVGKKPLQPFPLAQKSQFESWSPDSLMFVGVYGDGGEKDLILFDGTSGARTGTIPLGGLRADHPDWSPDSKRIVFTDVGRFETDQKIFDGAIAFVERESTAVPWSAPVNLVPRMAGKNRYYPAVAPDSSVVLFNECDAASHSDSAATARLWLARLPPAAPLRVELATANAPGVADGGKTDLTNSYPKWSPFAFELAPGKRLFWLTFASRRHYGLRRVDNGTRIWMAGVDVSKLEPGTDPSFAAFALPFQDLVTSNHIPQWTAGVAGATVGGQCR